MECSHDFLLPAVSSENEDQSRS